MALSNSQIQRLGQLSDQPSFTNAEINELDNLTALGGGGADVSAQPANTQLDKLVSSIIGRVPKAQDALKGKAGASVVNFEANNEETGSPIITTTIIISTRVNPVGRRR